MDTRKMAWQLASLHLAKPCTFHYTQLITSAMWCNMLCGHTQPANAELTCGHVVAAGMHVLVHAIVCLAGCACSGAAHQLALCRHVQHIS
jgi:hypothetical protein